MLRHHCCRIVSHLSALQCTMLLPVFIPSFLPFVPSESHARWCLPIFGLCLFGTALCLGLGSCLWLPTNSKAPGLHKESFAFSCRRRLSVCLSSVLGSNQAMGLPCRVPIHTEFAHACACSSLLSCCAVARWQMVTVPSLPDGANGSL